MTIARFNHTATLLSNGEVLVAGGSCSYTSCLALASAELYNPATGRWMLTGSMKVARENHTATLLASGKVLVAGGDDGNTPTDMAIASAELYDPSTGTWTLTGSMHVARFHHSAVKLGDGSVLVVGGDDGKGTCCLASPSSANGVNPYSPCFCPHGTASTEIYNPTTGTWKTTGKMNKPRTWFTAISIPDGTFRVLVAGGIQCSALSGACTYYNSAEIYDPTMGTWTFTGSLHTARNSYGASQLNPTSGQVIVAGGRNASGTTLTSTEIFTVSAKKRTKDQTTFIDQLCKSDPTAATVYNLAQAFGSLLRNREGKSGLEQWKGAVQASGIVELRDFMEGLADDAEAVVNGCTESWSNGMVEGFVNKVKWIKRSSYGQAGFPLLQRRVLLHPTHG